MKKLETIKTRFYKNELKKPELISGGQLTEHTNIYTCCPGSGTTFDGTDPYNPPA